MRYYPQYKSRHSICLQGYDYSQSGGYFVTICTQNRECLFGEIREGKMILNQAGEMIDIWWTKLFNKFSNLAIDTYIIMPNHLHGMINIVGEILCNRPNENMVIKGENMVSPYKLKIRMRVYVDIFHGSNECLQMNIFAM